MILFSCSWIILLHVIASAIAASEYALSGDNCSKQDTCYSKPDHLRTCSCEENCHVYGTCCQDIQDSQETPAESFRCYNRRTVTPVFVKRTCPEDFRGHVGIVDACLDEDEDEMDVKNNLLVTSHKTKVTYWNNHCALCNHEVADDLELWNIEVFCPKHKEVTRNLIRRNLTFDQEKSQWGLQIDDEFLQCIVKYAPPPYIDEVQHCTPNLVSSCLSNYTSEEIIRKCSEYYAERRMKSSGIYYKNIHCAICNYDHITETDCPGMPIPEDNIDEADFREMVQEVLTKFEWLPDKEYECSKGFAYDPARERCRSLEMKHKKPPVTISNSSNNYKDGHLTIIAVLFTVLALFKL